VAELVQHLEQDFLGGSVDPIERLVEQQQLGLLGDGPGDEDALALSAREGTEPVAGPVGETGNSGSSTSCWGT
jgi:hypothetical protein